MSTARQLVESAYLDDQRVLYNADETVTVPGDTNAGNWHIEPVDGGWTARNDADQGHIIDPGDRTNQRRRVFATLDGALFHILGDPQQ